MSDYGNNKERDIAPNGYEGCEKINSFIKRNYEPLDETEKILEEFECCYEPLNEDEEEVKNFNSEYEPLKGPENPGLDMYSTLDFITDIQSEISNVIPVSELHGGRISYDKLSEYLGMHKRYIRDTRSRIQNVNNSKYNPDFKFSKIQLESFLSSLSHRIKNVDLNKFNKIFTKYSVMNKLPNYRQEQWNLHNPNLKKEFFKCLDNTEKGYYFGLLLADGTSEKEKIGIFLEKGDFKVINRFRDVLRISNKIEHRIDRRKKKKSGEYPERYGVRVGCTSMIEDLKNLGFLDFKEGKALKDGFFTSLKREVALSVLLGFYDGDGEEGAPIIHSTNKPFLQQVKNEFKIKYDVQLKRKAGKSHVWIGESEIKQQYYLRIGPDIFNQVMKTYIYSMERKRKYFPMRMGKQAYEILAQNLKSKEILEEMVLIGPRTYLAKKLGCSFELFKRLCDDYSLKALPHSYWKKTQNKNWKSTFEQKFKRFKNLFLDEF
ncbi:MAG: hypothetical protein ACFFCV_11395 [Promethearchaeota archaeon]